MDEIDWHFQNYLMCKPKKFWEVVSSRGLNGPNVKSNTSIHTELSLLQWNPFHPLLLFKMPNTQYKYRLNFFLHFRNRN